MALSTGTFCSPLSTCMINIWNYKRQQMCPPQSSCRYLQLQKDDNNLKIFENIFLFCNNILIRLPMLHMNHGPKNKLTANYNIPGTGFHVQLIIQPQRKSFFSRKIWCTKFTYSLHKRNAIPAKLKTKRTWRFWRVLSFRNSIFAPQKTPYTELSNSMLFFLVNGFQSLHTISN